MSDALLIEGLWAAEEAVDEDEDGPAENADVMLEEVAPLQVSGTAVGLWGCQNQCKVFRVC